VRLSTAVREVLKACLVSPARVLLPTIVMIVLISASAAVHATKVARGVSELDASLVRGSYVFLVEPVETTHTPELTLAACEGLSRLPGVRAAGGIVRFGEVGANGSPDGRYAHLGITSGGLDVLRAPPSQHGYMGGTAAQELGIGDTGLVSLDGAPPTTRMALPAGTYRSSITDRAFVDVAPASDYAGSCLVEFEPIERHEAELVLPGLLSVAPGSITVSQLDPAPLDRKRVEADYTASAHRLVGVGTALAGAAVVLLGWRARRREYLVYQELGGGWRPVSMLKVVETSGAALLALVVGFTTVGFVARGTEATRTGIVDVITGVIVASILLLIAALPARRAGAHDASRMRD